MDKDIENIGEFIAQQIAVQILNKAQENLILNKSTDTGFLLRSGDVKKEDYWVVHFNAPYASDIEFGTKPHNVSPKRLQKWVERKLGVNKKKSYAVAKKISQNIEKRGTEPKPYLIPAQIFVMNNLDIKNKTFK